RGGSRCTAAVLPPSAPRSIPHILLFAPGSFHRLVEGGNGPPSPIDNGRGGDCAFCLSERASESTNTSLPAESSEMALRLRPD
ncbi:MAG TPA: hypothetical protein VKV32_18675, partial [Stellaceae bacterium]|nr:hypothetical protein [Stellaceae bacterium]